jgi:hypothetical protein
LCEPTTLGLILGGLNAAQTTLSIQAQNDSAEASAKAANDAAISDYQQLEEQARQIGVQGAGENLERTRQALRERSRLRVAMGEAGVEGNSPLREVANSFLQEGFDKGIINTNVKNRLNQTRMETSAVFSAAKSRINQAKASVVNPAQAVLQIGAAGMSGYASGYQMGNIFGGGVKIPMAPSAAPVGAITGYELGVV